MHRHRPPPRDLDNKCDSMVSTADVQKRLAIHINSVFISFIRLNFGLNYEWLGLVVVNEE